MLCGPHCSQLSTILNNIVTPESGSTILFNIVDKCEQCGPQNIVQSCFARYAGLNYYKAQSNCNQDPTFRRSSLVSSSGVI
jgi:hypothetical protein